MSYRLYDLGADTRSMNGVWGVSLMAQVIEFNCVYKEEIHVSFQSVLVDVYVIY